MATEDVIDEEEPIFAIAVAAELAGMHPQTLRQYDRLGLVTPGRTQGGSRRYSLRHVKQLREVAALSAEGEEQVTLLGLVSGSAKRYGNKLEARQLSRLMKLAKEGADAQATGAASLMGALQLPNADLLPLIVGGSK